MSAFDPAGNGYRPPPGPPQPRLARFEPLRAGIAGLWQYDDQEFWFHRGRLMLRGENGMGKSKALELLLPFLLDADLRPERLDPFGERSRSMRWNLLGEDGASGLGYSWLEFGRLEGRVPRFVTIGAGLRATRSGAAVDRWFFVSHGRRGIDFELFDDGRRPHTKERLKEALGETGRVFDSKDDYRGAVDADLFGLGPERYAALIGLLLQLRRPQLSKTLDPAELSRLLITSLPPLDETKVEQLADALEQLERLDGELLSLDRSRSSLDAFLQDYRKYAALEARRLGATVRTGASRLYDVTRREKEAGAELDRVVSEFSDLERSQGSNADSMAAARAERSALEDSDAMRSATELSRLRDEVRAAREHESERASIELAARDGLARASRRRERAGAALTRSAEQVEELLAAARRGAAAADLSLRHEIHESALRGDPEGARPGVLGTIEGRRRTLAELLVLGSELHDAQRTEAERRRSLDEAEAVLGEARAELDAAVATTQAARVAFAEDLEAWRAGVVELSVTDRLFASMIETAGGGGFGDLLLGATNAATRAPAAKRESLARDHRSLQELLDELRAEAKMVAEERDDAPPAIHSRPWRDGADGAPLWRVCDFRAHLGDKQQALLEAALEGSGLLDAWITPEGRVLDDAATDVFLVSNPVDGDGLLDALAPVEGASVAVPVIEAVLSSVSLGEAGDHRVAVSGSWRLGPLEGYAEKPAAQYIGAAARERARALRLVELERRIIDQAREMAEVSTALEVIEARERLLGDEGSSIPTRDRLHEAIRHEDSARIRTEVLEGARDEAAVLLKQASGKCTEARRILAEAAETAGVHGEPERIRELNDALTPYRDAVVDLADGLKDLAKCEEAELASGAEVEVSERALREAAERVSGARERRIEASSRAATAEAMVGAAVEQVLAMLEGVKERESALDLEAKALVERDRVLIERRAAAGEKLRAAGADRVEREAERDRSVSDFRKVLDEGLLPLVVPEAHDSQGWNATRALDLAREVLSGFGDEPAPDELDRARSTIWNHFNHVRGELAGDIELVAEQSHSLFVVRIDTNGRRHEVVEFVAFLGTEIARRRADFEAEEREVIEDFLIKELGVHLQERIEDARSLVAHMNGQLSSHPTASGLKVSLRWRALDMDGEGVGDMVKLLRKDLALMAEAELDALIRFLRRRISLAREDETAGRYADHLSAALDYRLWHTFEIVQEKDGQQQTLTRKRHAQGSGGEKSVALHLPLFAAAAAHYSSASEHAPRLIMLDEAFAGIDQGMRASCLGLLQSFDLDSFMTSHEEWGFYPELDGISTYQLARDPAVPGVAATRFVWNGRSVIQDERDDVSDDDHVPVPAPSLDR